MNGDQLAATLNTALGLSGVQVTVGITPTLVIVSHPSLTSANDAAVNAAIAAYVFDPLYDARAPAQALIGAASDQTTLVLRALVFALIDQLNTLRASYPIPVTSITRVTTTATATTAVAHGLTTGRQVFTWGSPITAYNGLQTITVTSPTTFTYTVSGSPATPATPGALIVYPVNSLFAPITPAQAVTAIQNKIPSGGGAD